MRGLQPLHTFPENLSRRPLPAFVFTFVDKNPANQYNTPVRILHNGDEKEE
jgi:hypothetical protein